MDLVNAAQLIEQVRLHPDIWYWTAAPDIARWTAWLDISHFFFPQYSHESSERQNQMCRNVMSQWVCLMEGFLAECSTRQRLGIPLEYPHRDGGFAYFTSMKFLLPDYPGPSSQAASDQDDLQFLLSLLPEYRRVPEEAKLKLMSEILSLVEQFSPTPVQGYHPLSSRNNPGFMH